jgi:pyruvate dehydrogenase E2 component (dihydrolipoamide acetyltransferase)
MSIELLMPSLSPTMEEGTLAKWFVKVGDTVSSGDLLAEIETDKATMEFEAIDDGIVGSILVEAGTQNIKVNSPIAILLEDGETEAQVEPKEQKPIEKTEGPVADNASSEVKNINTPIPTDRIFASPLARKIAQDKNIDLSTISGSGPRGRIVKADLIGLEKPASYVDTKSSNTQIPTSISVTNPYEEVELNGMRKTVASRLTEAKQTVPHFYLRRDIQIDKLLEMRAELNETLSETGQKLSVNDFIIKACAKALIQNPDANVTWAGDKILKYTNADVAVAVAVDGGLFTPVLTSAQSKSLTQLSDEMKDLASRAREKKLAPHEYQGGSFAISNLGMFGIDNFDAVINPPHGAILAVGAGKKRPIVSKDGTLAVATVMSVTLSVDHRSIDGALGALLLNSIVKNLESPLCLLL